MKSITTLLSFASLLALIPTAVSGLDLSSYKNVAVYWGQNSINQAGANGQQRLGYYCANTEFNTVQLAFLLSIANPTLNFANAGDNCTTFPGSSLFDCPQLASDIAMCQSMGKTILLSVGGATYTEGGFSSSTAAVTAANNIWAIFGPQQSGSSALRPFGSTSVDGFDFDFESGVQNMVPFANQLRSLMDSTTASTGRKFYLTAAPQCPYPDAADGAMLNGAVFFDAIWVQFYNNYCGLQSYTPGTATQNNFNFNTWDNWAKTVSKNPNVKVLLGAPGSPSAAGSGYETGSALASIISYCKSFSSFGGVMTWDMSQIYGNSGWLDGVYSDLTNGSPPPPPPPSTTTSTTMMMPTSTFMTITTKMTTTTTSSAAATGTGAGTVNQWNQCAGQGWTGGTVCKSPYTCVYLSIWYSQCE